MYWKNLLHFRTMWRLVGPKPKHLYKFHSVNDHLFDLLSNSSLWACKASELNDPYDCDFEMSAKYFRRNYLDKISFADMGVTGYTQSWEKDFFETVEEVISPEALQNLQRVYKSGLGVCCFTTDPHSELMWSHYAGAAKGVCLQFGFRDNPHLMQKIVRVKYNDKTVTVVNDLDRFHALFKKRKAWAYEKEWRLLSTPGKVNFQVRDLQTIIFGPQFDAKKYMQPLLDQCRTHYPHLKFSVCKYTKAGVQIESLEKSGSEGATSATAS